MSWHYSQALVAEYWRANYWAGELSALLKSTGTQEKCSPPGKTTEPYQPSPSGEIFEPLTATRGADVLRWYLAASPAKTSRKQARKKASPENALAFGWKWRESFAKWSRVTLSWRTRQNSLFEDSTPCLVTWPNWGWMRDGESSALPMLEHDTSVRGSLSLPTVTASWDRRGPGLSFNLDNRRMSASATDSTHKIVLHFGWRWPTPVLEWMMMWPVGWSALTPLVTDRFQAWLQEHGAC